jgi:hypothetical protein
MNCCSGSKFGYFAIAIGVAVAIGTSFLPVEAAAVQAPRFEVDPMWPKPLPNHWVIGATIGVGVDGNDNVWIIHRPASLEAKEQYSTMTPKASECCAAAPPILAFNKDGDLIQHWGRQGRRVPLARLESRNRRGP